MTINLKCGSCGKAVSATDGQRGRQISCPSCGSTLTVPGSFETSSARRRMSAVSRPRLVSILALYNLVQGAFAFFMLWSPPGFLGDLRGLWTWFIPIMVFAAVSIACAIGLWTLQRWGRVLQIGLAFVGLIGFPVVTAISVLILVYMNRADTRLIFSGRPIPQLTPAEQAEFGGHTSTFDQAVSGCLIVMMVLLIGAGTVLILTTAVVEPAFESALDASIAKRSWADIRTLGTAVATYRLDEGRFPPDVTDILELAHHLSPTYLRKTPVMDSWDRPFEVSSAEDGSWIEIASLGRDGVRGERPGGPMTDPDADIVSRNGRLIQWPAGVE